MTLSNIIIEHDVEIVLRDGTRTYADVYRPDDGERRPVILSRTIYGKTGQPLMGLGVTSDYYDAGPLAYARSGYVFVIQDCRGCFSSEGDWEYFYQEREDGYDSIEWAAKQDWSNGKVGVLGNSALGMTAFQAVASGAPSLVTAWIAVGGADLESWTKRGGVPSELYFLPDFVAGVIAPHKLQRLDIDEAERTELAAKHAKFMSMTQRDLMTLPLFADFELLKDQRLDAGLWNAFTAEPTDPYWKKDEGTPGKDPSLIKVPVKAFTGVFDVFAGSMIRALSNSDLGHELIIGPWGHYGGYQLPYGVRQHQHAPGGKAWQAVALAWFDRWLKGVPEQSAPGSSKVYYFMSGENQWTTTPAWPPAGATRELFLSSEDSTEGGAALTFDRPVGSGSRTYTYDPSDPVQTVGGVTIELTGAGLSLARFDKSMANDGVHDQRRIEGRDDILLYTSPALEEAVRVAGSPKVNLWVSSSAEDTDFLVRLVDVEPDGFAANVSEGIVRCRYRDGRNDSWLTPDEPVELEIEMDPVAHTFLPGHQIRVHVTSSSFPKYSRNLNTRAVPEFGTADDVAVAHQTVLDGGGTPSRISVNVVPVSDPESPYFWPYG
ncbi:CocE/NonD family hydrolase [Sphaerisporangium sp. NPDC051017]|uniref:CocE/NonD family hydrolase n=1 Tax=Sphaerisporangium sp. NPDC051017 TaxID=3154636 RepID=UPI003420C711